MASQRPDEQVLTLHRDVLARLLPDAYARRSQDFLGSVAKAERMMAQLAGLRHGMGGFSAQAWAMATAIAETPALCARLGMQARTLRVDELAELVQVVLEEEETPELDFAHDAAGALQPAMARREAQTPRPGAAQKRKQTSRLGAAQARKTPPQTGLQRQLQRVLAQLRAEVRGTEPAQSTAAMLQGEPASPLGDVQRMGSVDLAAVGRLDPVLTSPLREILSVDVLARLRTAAQQPKQRLDVQAQLALVARGHQWTQAGLLAPIAGNAAPRMLRLSEAATEQALLQPGAPSVNEAVAPDVMVSAEPARRRADAPQVDAHRDAAAGAMRRSDPRPAPASGRGLTAAVAQVAAAAGRERALDRMALPRPVGLAEPRRATFADRTSARVAAMTPHWQRTLTAWADADSPVARGPIRQGGGVAQDRPRGVAAADAYRFADDAGEILRPGADLTSRDAAAALGQQNATGSAMPRWVTGNSPSPARPASAARPAGPFDATTAPTGSLAALRADAWMAALLRRHAGGLATPMAESSTNGGALAAWQTPIAGYRGLNDGERTTVALAPEVTRGGTDATATTERVERRTASAPASAAPTQPGATRSLAGAVAARSGRPAPPPRPWARATAAAVQTLVAEAHRWRGRATPAADARASRGLLQFARGETAVSSAAPQSAVGFSPQATTSPRPARSLPGGLPALLAVRPHGHADALTPWLAPAARSTRATAAPLTEATLLAPGLDDLAAGSSAAALAIASGAPTEAQTAAPQRARALAAGAMPALVPAALRAALAVFGERAAAPADRTTAGAYLARFFGQAPPAGASNVDIERAVVALAAEPDAGPTATATAPSRAMRRAQAEAAPAADTPSPMLRGMAALEALMAGPAAADALLRQSGADGQKLTAANRASGQRGLRVDAAEQTFLTPGSDAGPVDASDTASTSPAMTSPGVEASRGTAVAPTRARAWGAAKAHQFSPVGLARGRGLLSRARAADNGTRPALTALASNARPSGAAAWSRRRAGASGAASVGYGAAALGGGELLGLSASDAEGFFGESAGTPGALRGADALATWVSARRGNAPIRGHAAAVAGFGREVSAGEFVQPEAASDPNFLTPANMPSNFSFGGSASSTYQNAPQATLLEAGGVAARQAQAAARATGPTASGRAVQASAMARVLSVTDSPTSNMLPLVAPAAHAVVTAAAAKPQSEHIVTSGFGPGQGTATHSLQNGDHPNGEGAHGHGESGHGHDAQDLDALAAKIARSVMTRMQRERERRGQYG